MTVDVRPRAMRRRVFRICRPGATTPARGQARRSRRSRLRRLDAQPGDRGSGQRRYAAWNSVRKRVIVALRSSALLASSLDDDNTSLAALPVCKVAELTSAMLVATSEAPAA